MNRLARIEGSFRLRQDGRLPGIGAGVFLLCLCCLAGATVFAEDGTSGADESAAAEADTAGTTQLPFILDFVNEPKVGLRASVRNVQTYAEWMTTLSMRQGSKATNTAGWSWDDFRQQEKTSENRSEMLSYNSGVLLPLNLSLVSSWDWSEDETLNNAGLANIARRDFKVANFKATKSQYATGIFKTDLTGMASLKDQQAENQGVSNDFSEASVGAQVKTKFQVRQGLSMSVRAFGQALGGDRALGESTSPSSATQDSLGVRVNFNRRYMRGFVEVTRGRFEEEFLDFNRNSNGLIDTTNFAEADKIVEEMKTQNATVLDFGNLTRLGNYGFETKAQHKFSDLAYEASGLGRTEREEDRLDLTVFRASPRDSIALTYGYLWKWDDQRIKGATTNRGRQVNKDRSLDLYWKHILFSRTEAILKFQQSLSQSIAENQFNQNDRDRVRNDVTFGITRNWSDRFIADMLFAYKSAEDISIRATRSSNNTVKDSYEIAPSYDWVLSRWVTLNQDFRLYIQFTDYTFSDLESVNKDDNYNKRGNMNTSVTIRPTGRLTLGVKHDYNRRFNATRVRTDATGNSYYSTDDRQKTSKIDLSARFEVSEGVTLEGATYSRLDEKERLGATTTVTENRAGQVWTGIKVSRSLNAPGEPIDFYCLVKKYYAYGPAVNETSADYWEADISLKWKF